MPNATLPRPDTVRPSASATRARRASRTEGARADRTSQLLADAVAEFDAALDAGRPMFVLSRLDREVVAATRRHDAALTAARRR